jgi:hypothetical protein
VFRSSVLVLENQKTVKTDLVREKRVKKCNKDMR